MNHTNHIIQNKETLDERWKIMRKVREFFWSQYFVEVETPLLLNVPGQEPYLSPMKLSLHNERGEEFTGYLHTSPEYTLKKMLAGGYENIFSITKCFRDQESFGGIHNPEFTMIEWYRTGVNFEAIMKDVEELLLFLSKKFNEVRRVSMKELWQEILDVNLDELLTVSSMKELCVAKGYNIEEDERYEDLFYRMFLNHIEPKLLGMGAVIIHHYPAQMAALAKLSEADERYAERFELYINGMEIANAFSELTNSVEQRARLVEERNLRVKLGKEIFNIDEEFLFAVGNLPECSGIALGIDRLVQVLLGCQNIDDVLVLPSSKLFSSQVE